MGNEVTDVDELFAKNVDQVEEEEVGGDTNNIDNDSSEFSKSGEKDIVDNDNDFDEFRVSDREDDELSHSVFNPVMIFDPTFEICVLLTVVGVDPNNNIFLISYVIVCKECRDTWEWFLTPIYLSISIKVINFTTRRVFRRHLHHSWMDFTSRSIITISSEALKHIIVEEGQKYLDISNIDSTLSQPSQTSRKSKNAKKNVEGVHIK
ncbi:hypothetical protein Pfo_003805 [Paulownia fortunei]|nr:hypothetical protein Pfo_003805 [Paulownia fortunei]